MIVLLGETVPILYPKSTFLAVFALLTSFKRGKSLILADFGRLGYKKITSPEFLLYAVVGDKIETAEQAKITICCENENIRQPYWKI